MSADHQDISPGFRDPADFSRLGDLLAAANYTDRGVSEAVQVDNVRAISGTDLPLLLRATAEPNRLNTLIRLFLVGVPVDIETVEKAVAPMTVRQWIDAGLLRQQGESVEAVLQLLPFQDLIVAFDMPRRMQAGLSANYVMGVGSSTLTLANLTVRRPSRLSLDLGTGCGLLAFLAAPHSERVFAVDTNPRAVEMAAFNARLNGLANVECLEGDLFEPVAEHRFDLVVSNPPFVISPEQRYIYRDSGMHGDEVTRKIVRQVPDYLNEGGYCQILCNWAHVAGQDWQERLAEWFEATGCDAWVMRTDTLDAAAYAAKWIRHTERDDAEQFAKRYHEWTDYYRNEQIEAVSGGLITMRRREGASNWFRSGDGPEKMLGPAGDGIESGFEMHDFLDANPNDEQLLGQAFRLSPDARLHQEFAPSEDGWAVVESQLQLARGLAYTGNIDPYVARLLARCDGRRRLVDLIEELAGWVDQDAATITPTCLDIVRRLVLRGLLLPGQASEDD